MELGEGVYLVKPGKVIYDEVSVRYASSSVVLIEDGELILVDTALEEDWPLIEEGIRRAGFRPSQVGMVVNTHLHPDHMGCNHRFEAEHYAHPLEMERTGLSGYLPCPSRLSGRVRVMETPGHVEGHLSVVFGGVVAAGDAIPTRRHHEEGIIPRIHTDALKARESMRRIAEVAEVIVPGHDLPFPVRRRA
jgi:glyoxylase-like metal-dependent hydrolase (beta-lactamase superfamily II)